LCKIRREACDAWRVYVGRDGGAWAGLRERNIRTMRKGD
jgi:hypothetical protein